jgi:hypothetical protein
VTGRREPDDAAAPSQNDADALGDKAASLVAWNDARVAEIHAKYEECMKNWGRYLANAARIGVTGVPCDPEGCARRRDKALKEQRDDFLGKAAALETEQRLSGIRRPTPEDERGAPVIPVANDPPGLRRTPGPDPEFHERGTIAAALLELHHSRSVKAAVDASGLGNKDVLRAEQIERLKGFRLDGTTLWVHPKKVQMRDGKFALRVLHVDGDGPRWADPL